MTSPSNRQRQHVAQTLLNRAHSPSTSQEIFKDLILRRPLLLRPTTTADQPTSVRQQRQAARERRQADKARRRGKSATATQKPRPLSAKQKRALCLYDVPQDQKRYEVFEPLHGMWLDYVRELLGLGLGDGWPKEQRVVDVKSAGPVLAAADFHGAEVEVVRCRSVGRVGIKGIVAKETKGTFEIITRKNELKVVPKEYTIFKVEIQLEAEKDRTDENELTNQDSSQSLIFELHGSQFNTRPAERSVKKFRIHIPPDL